LGGDLSRPLPKPKGGKASPSAPALSDDFSVDRFGLQWSFHEPTADEAGRAVYESKALRTKGRAAPVLQSQGLRWARFHAEHTENIRVFRRIGVGALSAQQPKHEPADSKPRKRRDLLLFL
jgi:hypothetical protein